MEDAAAIEVGKELKLRFVCYRTRDFVILD
jgi:hypothetical protein